MKHLFVTVIAVIVISFSARAQYVNIPDPQFRQFLQDYYPQCMNANMLDTSCSAIVNATSVDITYQVSNWEGFQYFKNLQVALFSNYGNSFPDLPNTLRQLIISGGPATSLPTLPSGLIYLKCNNMNNLTSLVSLPPSLAFLDCSYNYNLTQLPSLPASLTYLNCSNANAFTSLPALPAGLDTLECERCNLTSLPTLPATLQRLNCNINSITSLPSLPSQLKYLNCGANMLTSLPTLPNQLEYIEAGNNSQLSTLPALPGSLKTLSMGYTSLNSLPTLPAGLVNLYVGANQLSSLPTLPAGLLQLDCGINNITSLPTLPANLTYLGIYGNHITTVPVLPLSLTSFTCHSNLITVLPDLPPLITNLTCYQNQLTSLPPLPPNLNWLECYSNQLYFLPVLPATLSYLKCEGNNLTCLPVLPTGQSIQLSMDDEINCLPNNAFSTLQVWHNNLTTVDYYNNGSYPLCSAINNVNHCDAFPLMEGHVFNDNNNNLIHDANEPFRANVKVELSNGAWTYTNNNGYYQIPADNTGNYTLTVVPPNYFTSAPLQFNYNFNSFDTLVTNDFALQATTTIDSLFISVNPVNTAARPGFAYPYLISYENAGTTTLSPTIVFNFDNTRLIYDSSSNAAVINNGSNLSLSEPAMVAGQRNNFIGYFKVNPSAVIGDSLRAYGHITANAAAANDSDVVAIRGSMDPNDKSATPNLSPVQVANGDYIYYTIRFQNTGTDTAFSIVVTDTLNNKLQPSTMQMIATSHPCIATVKGNTISFEFINIILPDSNVNQFKSHGYISFRIKPVNTLVVNDIVPNKAAIYFDYNNPVITNIATTTVVDPIVVPLKLISFIVSRAVGQNANLYWQTSNEVSVQHYEMEMSTNGRTFATIGFENAKGYQYNSYTRTIAIPSNPVLYFRLKMVDIDGRYAYSNVAILRNDNTNNSFSFLNNPVKDELNISLQDESLRNTFATIFNAQGANVKTILLQDDVENINVRSLPAGTYYLVTEKGSRQFVIIR